MARWSPIAFAIALGFAVMAPGSGATAAATNSLAFSPATATVDVGAQWQVSIGGTSAPTTKRGKVAGTVHYPTDLVDVATISTSGSSFGTPNVSDNAGTGTITFSGVASPAPTGAITVFTVTFRAVKAGTAAMSFGAESKVNGKTTALTGASYTLNGTTPPGPAAPFTRGVNLSTWFQKSSAAQISINQYELEDFQNIKSLGADVIRLPVNFHAMTSGAPDFTLDPLLLHFLDTAVGYAEQTGLQLVLDNHSNGSGPGGETTTADEAILRSVWTQLAQHYADGYAGLHYEILNEPHGIDPTLWGQIQGRIISTIRAHDQRHSIVVTGVDWSGVRSLPAIPAYTDPNLIYTFHFYDPFLFTHQGATWTQPSLANLRDIPFPYDAATMPALPDELRGTWVEQRYNAYPQDGTAASVSDLIRTAGDFARDRQVRVWAGEFGVFDSVSPPDDRVDWYRLAREQLEQQGLSWTSWDYHGGFGLFTKGGSGLIDHDLNVPLVQALGFTAPPQTPFEPAPDSAGFTLYDDALGHGVNNASGGGQLSLYASDSPHSGDFSIRMSGPARYDKVAMDFAPHRDLNLLRGQGYVLDFWVRTTAADLDLDVRFVDSDTGSTDHPWRIGTAIEVLDGPAAGWRHFRVPLTSLSEKGSWEGQWYSPQGLFDWTAVDRLEFVAETRGYPDDTFWIDDVSIAAP